MRYKYLVLQISAAVALAPWGMVSAQTGTSFQVIATFDYPGSTSTITGGINDNGDVAGEFGTADILARGYIRLRSGRFSAPVVETNDDQNATALRGITNARTAAGFYRESDGGGGFHDHGFIFSRPNSFTEFDLPGTISTTLVGINEVGNLCGNSQDGVTPPAAWVSIDGTVFTFRIPMALSSGANGINNLNQSVGSYYLSTGKTRGFFRDADGTLTYPLALPDGSSTSLNGINEAGQMVGSAAGDTGSHAVLFNPTGEIVLYDYPGASNTVFTGINNKGLVAGWYMDSLGFHGFIVRIRSR